MTDNPMNPDDVPHEMHEVDRIRLGLNPFDLFTVSREADHRGQQSPGSPRRLRSSHRQWRHGVRLGHAALMSDDNKPVHLSPAAMAKARDLVQEQYDTWAAPGEDAALDDLARALGLDPA